mmetsp:Transcript_26324/g.23201  ORF Transcript_26324/g.23201 Transcript_26324/m.23201 type:complete len:88 (-) Transcript_26324:2895-3158(-)
MNNNNNNNYGNFSKPNYNKGNFGGYQNYNNNQGSYSKDPFKRNLNAYQTSWGRRHLRSGFIDKEIEIEEEKLLEEAKESTDKHAGEM